MTKLLSPIPASLTTTVAFFATAWLVYQQRRVRRGERSTVFPRLLPSPSSSDRDKFVGAWILSSYHVDDTVTGDRIHPLGHDADGLILYTPDGYMSATLSSSKPAMFDESTNMAEVMKPGYPETSKMIHRWTDYVSYAGGYDVDVENRCVVHRVDVSMFPNGAGRDQVRAYAFFDAEDGTGVDTLRLSATFHPQIHVLLWKRAGGRNRTLCAPCS